MKKWILKKWRLGVILAVTPLAGGCLQQQSGIPAETPVSVTPGDTQQEADDSQPQDEIAVIPAEEADGSGLSDAPTKVVSPERPLPPNIRPTEALSTLIRLIQSNVDESVLLSYVTNSAGAFGLGPEEIIYLSDIGVPGTVVSAMLQHDHLMVDTAALANRDAIAESNEVPPSVPPSPGETAPPQGYVPDNPLPPVETAAFVGNFYDALAPYGTWVDVEGSGRCWQPSVVTINPGWQPYCDRGHWAYTDCGWYWSSDYSWGWAPFHYGRWFRHSHLGWCWSPDNVWGPSWVSWRYSNDYCGWAPLPPVAHFRPGLGFSYRGHSVGFNFNFGIRPSCYTFVPTKNFCDSRLSRHALPHDHVNRIFNTTVAVNKIVGDHNRISNYGIPAARITAATHTQIRQVSVQTASHSSAGAILTSRSGDATLAARNSSLPRLPESPSVIRGQSEFEQINGSHNIAGRGVAADHPRSGWLPARTPVNQVGHSEIPAKTPLTARDTSQKPFDGTDTARTSNGSASGRVARRDNSAPLIIHRSTSSRSASIPNPAERTAAATPVERAATARPRSQIPDSFSPNSTRAVEGRPRYERQETGYPPMGARLEAQNSFRPSPPAVNPQASLASSAGYVHQPWTEMPRFERVPSQPQAASYHHDTVPMRQPPVNSTQPAPSAHSRSTPAAASSPNQSSSEKRGR